MSYDPSYRQPQRQYQDEYYHSEQSQQYARHPANQRGQPMQQDGSGSRGQLNRFASQPGSMNASYRNDGMGAGGRGEGGLGFEQAQSM